MRKKIPVLDTNIIIRFLVSDNKKQADQVELLFKKSDKKDLEIPDLVIAEIVYILLSFYNLSKTEVINKINNLVDFEKFKTNKKIIKTTLTIYQEHNISFVDAYLCSLVFNGRNSFIYSFDKNLLRLKNLNAEQP